MQIDELMSKDVLKLSPHVEELIKLLHSRYVHKPMPEKPVKGRRLVNNFIRELHSALCFWNKFKPDLFVPHYRGVNVYLISGGFSHMILPIAKLLGIPGDRVYANELRFSDKGQYVDFNTQAFTS